MTKLLPEMYEFITKKENFEAFMEMVDDYEKAKPQIRAEFWNEVSNNLKNIHRTGWYFYSDKNLELGSAKIGFWYQHPHQGQEPIEAGIVFEQLPTQTFYGAWFDPKRFNKSKLLDALTSEDRQRWTIDNGQYFLQYKNTGDNFQWRQGLSTILPEVRKLQVDNYVGLFKDAFEKLAPFIETQVNDLIKTN